jgi:hypothetical protein
MLVPVHNPTFSGTEIRVIKVSGKMLTRPLLNQQKGGKNKQKECSAGLSQAQIQDPIQNITTTKFRFGFSFSFFFFLAALGFELRASHLLAGERDGPNNVCT